MLYIESFDKKSPFVYTSFFLFDATLSELLFSWNSVKTDNKKYRSCWYLDQPKKNRNFCNNALRFLSIYGW